MRNMTMQRTSDKTGTAEQGEERPQRQPLFYYEKGRLYFTKRTERMIFFVLTVAMLVWGLSQGLNLTGFGG